MSSGKIHTVPDQCMSLQEMFRRFVRHEPLPASKDGVYIEGEYDLEKVARMDRVEQEEILAEVKAKVSEKKKKVDEAEAVEKERKKQEKDAARKELLKELQQSDPKGVDPIKNPPEGA